MRSSSYRPFYKYHTKQEMSPQVLLSRHILYVAADTTSIGNHRLAFNLKRAVSTVGWKPNADKLKLLKQPLPEHREFHLFHPSFYFVIFSPAITAEFYICPLPPAFPGN
ncbi:MAG: hypothetical protein JW715_15575 [Sedimentisphaerales bacterium]|nr:hypothetical protein [Sedimentisphaerales bacterium]